MDINKVKRIKKYGEVFTPQWVVDKMCDELEKENPDCWEPHKTFLEPSCGEGIFILEILRRKFTKCKSRKDYTVSLESIYGFEIQADNVAITIQNIIILCEKYFKPTQKEIGIINDHIIQCDALKVMKLLNQK